MKSRRRDLHIRLAPDLFTLIEGLAASDRRKLQQQIEMMLEDWLRERGELPLREKETAGV